ncbi:MAG: hypothetical protein AAFV80_19515, partial [Bacteroidota bacterium]
TNLIGSENLSNLQLLDLHMLDLLTNLHGLGLLDKIQQLRLSYLDEITDLNGVDRLQSLKNLNLIDNKLLGIETLNSLHLNGVSLDTFGIYGDFGYTDLNQLRKKHKTVLLNGFE